MNSPWKLPRSECRSVVLDAKVRLGVEAGQAAAQISDATYLRRFRERVERNLRDRAADAAKETECVFHVPQAG